MDDAGRRGLVDLFGDRPELLIGSLHIPAVDRLENLADLRLDHRLRGPVPLTIAEVLAETLLGIG